MSEVATITIGKEQFQIPELPLGVMKKIWPITARMSQRRTDALLSGKKGFDISEANIDDAIELVAIGIGFGKPGFTRADLENIVADLDDIVAASIVVSIQAGGKRAGEIREAMKKAMATPPTESEAPTTSTESSPISA